MYVSGCPLWVHRYLSNLRRYLTNAQVRQLLGAINLQSPFGQRDHLLILFLYHTGLRVGECSRLLVTLVATKDGKAREFLDLPAMFCKGPRGRSFPLNATARLCIEKMLEFNKARGLSVAPAAPLFQNRKHGPLSIRSIQLLIESYRKKADLDVRATPHTLRHTHATVLQNTGAPVRVIQQGLGHHHLSTTERYLGIGPTDMQHHYARLGG